VLQPEEVKDLPELITLVVEQVDHLVVLVAAVLMVDLVLLLLDTRYNPH
jgi:hypothetical protein